MTPSTLGDKNAVFYFDTITPDNAWKSILRVKGWAGDYATWELAGPAESNINLKSFYVRSGIEDTWNDWEKLLTDKNYTDYTVTKTGSGANGTWGIDITGGSRELKRNDNASNTRLVYTNAMRDSYGWGQVMYDSNDKACYVYYFTTKDDEVPSIRIYGPDGHTNALVLTAANYTSYTPTKTGGGASGTWGISITGNAATASSVAWSGITGKPSSYTPSSHNHDYIYGTYTRNGGQQPPSYIGANALKCNMMNGFVGSGYSIPGYMDTLLMNAYSWSDVPYATALGILKTNSTTPRAWIACGPNGDSWTGVAELLTDKNYASYCLPLSGGSLSGLLTINTSGKYIGLGCQNAGYAHYSTNADTGHWFNKNVYVQGNIYSGSDYNTLVLTAAGGNLSSSGQITCTGRSTSWISGRDSAMIRTTSYTGYGAITSMKTTDGAWEMGVYTSNNMYFTYTPDTYYNSGTNNGYTQIRLDPSGVLFGAAWNDYAEFRRTVYEAKPGQIVTENGDGTQHITTERLQRGCNVVSDTFGFAIGETDEYKTPVACAGRALVYTYENRYDFQPGEAVCSGPNGTVSRMTREEMINNPDCIVGFVSEIPEYKVWGTGNVEVDGRIWIKVN